MSPRRWAFISDNRADFGVKRICRVPGVSRAGFYRHLATGQARAECQAEEKRTVAEIRTIHAEHDSAYGAPRVHADLIARGETCSLNRVARLMRKAGVRARTFRRFRVTTAATK